MTAGFFFYKLKKHDDDHKVLFLDLSAEDVDIHCGCTTATFDQHLYSHVRGSITAKLNKKRDQEDDFNT